MRFHVLFVNAIGAGVLMDSKILISHPLSTASREVGDTLFPFADQLTCRPSARTGSTMETIFDYAYLRQTNRLRFQTSRDNTVKVWTVQFSGRPQPETIPSAPTGLQIEVLSH